MIPWQSSKALAWDVTVIHSLADSYLSTSAPGGAVEIAAKRKTDKYSVLSNAYLFQPIALETLGPINNSGQSFIKEVGRRISLRSGDKRETAFLFQRLSIAIQRFNAVACRGTFGSFAETDS